jgi:hypothetical protein
VGQKGWDGLPEAARQGIGRPAPPSPEYLATLRATFAHHPASQRDKTEPEAAFQRFVEAQGVWDRVMAETIAGFLAKRPQTLVVGILGAGHVRHGHGVAHQLKALGVDRVGTLLTWPADAPCTGVVPGLADALFVVRPPAANPPRLGVSLVPDPDGVRLVEIRPDSLAAHAGLLADDVVIQMAGRDKPTPERLRAAVQAQPAGTWLPITVRRAGQPVELVLRFPVEAP